MKVLLISIASVLAVGVIILTSRLWGLGIAYTDFQHPFFESTKPLIVLKAHSEDDIKAALQKKSDMVFWLDVETTADQQLIVFSKVLSDKEISVEAYRGTKPYAYTFQQLAIQNPQLRSLKDVLTDFPKQRFVLNIMDNVEDVHLWVNESLKGLEPEKRIILQSNYNVVMESIKKLQPFWLYGCSQADLMRFLTFEGMWVLPSTPFKGDVYIAPFKLLGRPAFHDTTIIEAHRRFKKVLLGPALNKAQFDDAVRLKAEGLIIENLSDYLAWSRP